MENMMKKQNFGIEIEFNGISRETAANAIAKAFSWKTPKFETSYSTWYTTDNQGRKWKVVRDGSVNGIDSHKCELVSPILQYNDIEQLQEIVRVLRKAGAKVDSSCGIHVHVDKANHDAKSLRNLINIVVSKEEMINNAFGVHGERLNRWCKPVRKTLVDAVNSKKPKTIAELGDLWYQGYEDRYSHYSASRYHGLNLHNVWYAHTVEFRYFNSTLHAGKVKSYIQFCLAVSAQAIAQKSAKPTKTVSTNEKYTFRTWLLRLGLIGDEFKTARTHLLANLEGDIAFLNGRPERAAE